MARRIPKPKWIYAPGWPDDAVVLIEAVQTDGPYEEATYAVWFNGRAAGRIRRWRHTPHVKVGRLRRDLKPRNVWAPIEARDAKPFPYDTAGEAIARLMEQR